MSNKITFEQRNQILYGHDFRHRCGIPHGIQFTATREQGDIVMLRAPGYGEVSNYGNGALRVSLGQSEYVRKLFEDIVKG